MEPSRMLNSTVANLHNLSAVDLDTILKFDSPPLTESPTRGESLLHFNCNSSSQINLSVEHAKLDFANETLEDDLNLDFSFRLPNKNDTIAPSLVFSERHVDNLESMLDETTDVASTLSNPINEIKKEIPTVAASRNFAFCNELLNDGNDFDFSNINIDEIDFKISFGNSQIETESPTSHESNSDIHSSLIRNICRGKEPTNVDKYPQETMDSINSRETVFKRPISPLRSYRNKSSSPSELNTNPLELSQSSFVSPSDISEDDRQANTLPMNLSKRKHNNVTDNSQSDITGNSPNIACPSNSLMEELELSNLTNELNFDITASYSADASLIPSSVKQLYDAVKTEYSDFAFVYALSAQMCQDRVPMDCFVNFKMGLLLSLVSLGLSPNMSPISVVAIGQDTAMANYLMSTIGNFAERFVGPIDENKPPAIKSTKHVWIEADPILLAKGGIYYVGDWSRLKSVRADKIFKDVENCRVGIERTTTTYPLQTAIWTHWRSYKYNAKDQQTFNKFVKIFGIPITLDDDNHEVLVNYILEQASVRVFESTIDHLSISADEMREFLSVVSKRTVDLSQNASIILQKYFVASRIDRPDCLTKQAFVTMKQFAESFAKLSFRHEVLPIDAISAIYMSESFIQSVFGAGEFPPPEFKNYNYVGNVDEHMTKFQEWLRLYIERFYSKSVNCNN